MAHITIFTSGAWYRTGICNQLNFFSLIADPIRSHSPNDQADC